MMKQAYIRVFDPTFTYGLANNVGRWRALESYLRIVQGMMDVNDPNKPCPLQTSFYRYCENLVVLCELDGVHYCRILVGGVSERQYEVLSQSEELRAFFDACGDNVTVLDNDRFKLLEPTFDAVMTYVRAFQTARDIGEQHRETMSEYHARLAKLQSDVEEVRGEHLRNVYTDGVYQAEQYLITLNAVVSDMQERALVGARRCVLNDDNNVCRMFGLFVYALIHGIGKGRHLERHRGIFSHAFGEMLQELRTFMSVHPTIEEDYAQFMHLPANEREKLHKLLESEGVFESEWGYIGDDLF